MKIFAFVFSVTMMMMFAGNVIAEEGQVANLDAFGLSDMQVVSDVQGMAVHGMGKMQVYGHKPGHQPPHHGHGTPGWGNKFHQFDKKLDRRIGRLHRRIDRLESRIDLRLKGHHYPH